MRLRMLTFLQADAACIVIPDGFKLVLDLFSDTKPVP